MAELRSTTMEHGGECVGPPGACKTGGSSAACLATCVF